MEPDSSPVVFIQEIQRRERKSAQGEMGREKTKEEDVVFSSSPFPSSSALPPRALPCAT